VRQLLYGARAIAGALAYGFFGDGVADADVQSRLLLRRIITSKAEEYQAVSGCSRISHWDYL
jgi:energy-converting hydrogenase Eha subunit G